MKTLHPSRSWQAAFISAARAFDESKINRDGDGQFAPKGASKAKKTSAVKKEKAKKEIKNQTPKNQGATGNGGVIPDHEVKWSEIIETPSTRLSRSYPKEARPKLSEAEAGAVRRYSLAAHRDLNDALWNGHPIPVTHKDVDNGLKNAFAKVHEFKQPITVRRGANLSKNQLQSIVNAKIGDEVVFPAYTSTTTKSGTFKGNVEFRIAAIKGLDVAKSGGDQQTAKESELLLNKGSRFTILSIKKTGPRYKIELSQMREEVRASGKSRMIPIVIDTRDDIEFENDSTAEDSDAPIAASWAGKYRQSFLVH